MPESLIFGEYYRIYNRGNNSGPLFLDERNPPYFLDLYDKYVDPVAETYAYCLMRNHFHFLVRIREYDQLEQTFRSNRTWRSHADRYPSLAFSRLFSTYAKAINRQYRRTGSLFEKPFKRKLVDSDGYFACLVAYIHLNPQKHGFAKDFRDWPFSSYRAILSAGPTRLQRASVLEWFGGREAFIRSHGSDVDEAAIASLIDGDWRS